MPTVAVAGGTGGLGHTIADAIRDRKKNKVLVLSRKANPQFELENKLQVVEVNYEDVRALTNFFEDNNVVTVISALKISSSNVEEINLIKAAQQSKATTRFVPSVWGLPFNQRRLEKYPRSRYKYEAYQHLKTTSLEYTLFYIGFLTDYLGSPGRNSYMPYNTISIDVRNNVATLPGDGNVPVVFTHSSDVAKFVVASLDLPRWEEHSYLIGDKLTWNQVLKLAEEIKGVRFEVSYDSLDKLEAGKITLLPAHEHGLGSVPKEQLQEVLAIISCDMANGSNNFPPEKALNRVLPDVKPLSVRDVLEDAWKTS